MTAIDQISGSLSLTTERGPRAALWPSLVYGEWLGGWVVKGGGVRKVLGIIRMAPNWFFSIECYQTKQTNVSPPTL